MLMTVVFIGASFDALCVFGAARHSARVGCSSGITGSIERVGEAYTRVFAAAHTRDVPLVVIVYKLRRLKASPVVCARSRLFVLHLNAPVIPHNCLILKTMSSREDHGDLTILFTTVSC